MFDPLAARIGRRARKSAAANDPTAGDARSNPRPVGPTSRMSFAKIGRRATAPPSRTAKRSREIAPSKTRRPANEAHTGEHLLETRRPCRHRDTPGTDREHARERDERKRYPDHVHEFRLEREQETTDCRAGHEGELKRDRALSECADEDFPGNERGREGAPRGCSDRASYTHRKCEREERPHLVCTGERDREEPERHADVDHDHEEVEKPARDSVRELTGGQSEQRERKELREPDEPQVEWILPDGVHLPADGDRRHVHGEARCDQRNPEEREVAVAERGGAGHRVS